MSGSAVQLDIFYNTTHLTGNDLKIRRIKADAQSRLILAFFKMHPGELFTPFEVLKALNYDPMQITSVRRSITDLTNAGLLIKTDVMKQGELGSPNHCWRLR